MALHTQSVHQERVSERVPEAAVDCDSFTAQNCLKPRHRSRFIATNSLAHSSSSQRQEILKILIYEEQTLLLIFTLCPENHALQRLLLCPIVDIVFFSTSRTLSLLCPGSRYIRDKV